MTADEQQAFAAMKSRAALAGFELHLVPRDATGCRYQLRRWGRSRSYTSLAAVGAFLALVDGGPASAPSEGAPT